jgi:Protein of unknown function (DUF4242)
MGGQVQWVESYVTDNKIYCVYIAPSEQLGGFPAPRVSKVVTILDPTTTENA